MRVTIMGKWAFAGLLATMMTASPLPEFLPFVGGTAAQADSLYRADDPGLLSDRLGDRRSQFGPGALVTVLVTENLQASTTATTRAQKESKNGANWNLGSIIPQGAAGEVSVGGKTEFAGDGLTRRGGTITLEIAAVIQEVLADGSLRIEGKKDLRVNDEVSTVTIAGIIRPFDIDRGNRVASTRIADLKLDYKGAGPVHAKTSPGLLSRLFNWLF